MKWKTTSKRTRCQRVNTENYYNNCFQFLVYVVVVWERARKTQYGWKNK